jgi:predicted transcriptional regulator
MAETLPIPKALARRLTEQAQRLGKTPRSIAVEAIEKALDYDAWLLKELDRADAEIERGDLIAGEVVKGRARAVLRKHGGAKAA